MGAGIRLTPMPRGSRAGAVRLGVRDRRNVGAAALGLAGAAAGLQRRSLWPLIAGAGGAVALAVGAHPLFEGNTAENLGHPLWAARAIARMSLRTITGSIRADLEQLEHARAAEG